jgi:hypothetical protein
MASQTTQSEPQDVAFFQRARKASGEKVTSLIVDDAIFFFAG